MLSPRLAQLQEFVNTNKVPRYRFEQIKEAIYKHKIQKYDQITNIPLDIKQPLKKVFGEYVSTLKVSNIQKSSQATKVLFELKDGQKIESVHMKFLNGHTSLCISSQVGCALKCSFCATGAVGFKRQLCADEITDQILYFIHEGHNVDSVSFMGMGEPLMNPRIFDALQLLTSPQYFHMSQRSFSVSTVGIIPAIQRLTTEFPQVNLAFSLHSPFEDQRNVLVPANKTYPLHQVMPVLEQHALKANRKIFLAYLVLDGHNDTGSHANGIVDLIQKVDHQVRHLFHVNLLRYNPAFGIGEEFTKTQEDNLLKFMKKIGEGNVPVTIRRSFGVDIDAACGQLYPFRYNLAHYQRYAKYPPKVQEKMKSI